MNSERTLAEWHAVDSFIESVGRFQLQKPRRQAVKKHHAKNPCQVALLLGSVRVVEATVEGFKKIATVGIAHVAT